MIDFKNQDIEIYAYDATTYTILVKNFRKANRLNKLLCYYDGTIKEGEEPIFKAPVTKMIQVLAVLRLKSLFRAA